MLKQLITSTLILASAHFVSAQNIGINSTGATPDASATLDVSSTNGGLLVPRMILTQRNAITTPATSLLIYQTDNTPGFYYYNGTAWVPINSLSTNPNWSKLGNASTINGTHFIGTTNGQNLDIRTNNVIRVRITQKGQIEILNTGGSTFLGENAGMSDNLISNYNTYIGYRSGQTAISGSFNVGLGSRTLESMTIANNNTGLGTLSLNATTTGSQNTAVGTRSGASNTTGGGNSAYGEQALYANISGNYNTALGGLSLASSTGANNVGLGYGAGSNITTGSNNIMLGYTINAQSATGSNQLNIGNLIFSNGIDGTNSILSTGSIGVGISSPLEKLDVAGAIKFSNTNSTNLGTIRWTGTDFEGYTGSGWLSLTAPGGTSLWTTTGTDIYRPTGAVGIGLSPSGGYALDVQGTVRISPPIANSDFIFSNNGFEPTFLPSTNNFGYVGSNLNRIYQGHFSNLTVYNTFTNLSDRAIKENIKPINSALSKILALSGKTYDLKREFALGDTHGMSDEKIQQLEAGRMNKIGFIAQELEEILPELVHYNEESKLKSVDYIGVIPVLVESIKEQQEIINTQDQRMKDQDEKIEELYELILELTSKDKK